MLADKGTKLVELGALGYGNPVLVTEVLELGLAPGIDELVGQGCISSLGAGGGTGLLFLHAEIGKAGVAANSSDKLVSLQ